MVGNIIKEIGSSPMVIATADTANVVLRIVNYGSRIVVVPQSSRKRCY